MTVMQPCTEIVTSQVTVQKLKTVALCHETLLLYHKYLLLKTETASSSAHQMFQTAALKKTSNFRSFVVKIPNMCTQDSVHHELCIYLRQVTVIAGQAEVQFFCVIICKNPWEYWILVQVIVRPTCGKRKTL